MHYEDHSMNIHFRGCLIANPTEWHKGVFMIMAGWILWVIGANLNFGLRVVVCLQEAKNAVGTLREGAFPPQPLPAQPVGSGPGQGQGPGSHPMGTQPR
jgi:hypothetical protein